MKLETISCEKIMTTSLKPIEFCVENLIASGLYILAGVPKSGKSWLALDICLSIAKGEKVLDKPTVQGTSLYLCLEDSETRLQNRLYEITDEPAEKLYFSLLADSIGRGLENQIESFKKEHSDLKMVFIDTLQKVRNDDESNYGSDYRELSVLKNLAEKLSIAVVLVHHLRKCYDSDPFNMISGSSGLRGCVDGAFVLQITDKQNHEAVLYCEGRDIESREIKIRFSSVNHQWEKLADSITEPEKFDDEIVTAMVTVMKSEKSFIGTPTELTEKINQYTKQKYIPNIISKKLLQSADRLIQQNILFEMKRSNGTRKIAVRYINNDSADSDDEMINVSDKLVVPAEKPVTT